MPPVSGATLPIAIVRVAGACAFLSFAAAGNATMAAIREHAEMGADHGSLRFKTRCKTRLIMRTAHGAVNFPRRSRAEAKRPAGSMRPPAAPALLAGFAYLTVRMYSPRVFASSSPTVPFGGIGMGPHTPVEPSLDLLHEIGLGVLSGLVLGRHFLVRGPTSFLSTA